MFHSKHIKWLSLLLPVVGSLLIFFVPFRVTAQGATYYVASDGADTNPGTKMQPFATPQKAIDLAQPGDTIVLKAGHYAARLQFHRSGQLSAPITLVGEDGAIVDAGEKFTGWQSAPEIGTGVYKHTSLPYDPFNLLWNDKYILRIRDDIMASEGKQILRDGPQGSLEWNGPVMRSWNGIEAMWGTQNHVTYIRFRDNRNPNNEQLMFAPQASDGGAPVTVINQSYIIIRNLTLINGQFGVYVTNNTHHVTIEQNRFVGQHHNISVYYGPHHITIQHNDFTLGYIHSLSPDDSLHWFIWYAFKKSSDYDRTGVYLYQAGSNNLILDNSFHDHWDGIAEDTSNDPSTQSEDLLIARNSFATLADQGVEVSGRAINVYIDGNSLRDCNDAIRVKDAPTGPLYIYRNTIQGLPDTHSENWGIEIDQRTKGSIYIYHNSISTARTLRYNPDVGGSPNIWYINNIFSSVELGSANSSDQRPHFDYNWIGGTFTQQSWMYQHNIVAAKQRIWSDSATDLTPPADSSVRAAGLDLSHVNVLDSVTLPALPGMEPGYFTDAAPAMGAMQFLSTPSTTLTATPVPTFSITPTDTPVATSVPTPSTTPVSKPTTQYLVFVPLVLH